MVPGEVPTYAALVRDVLRALGPRPSTRIVTMLQALGLSGAEAQVVLAYGRREGLIDASADDPAMLLAPAREVP